MKKRLKKINVQKIAASLLGYLFKTNLAYPVYMKDIHCEEDCTQLGSFPVVYVWNNDQESGNFSVSVNGNPVAHLLEASVPRSHPKFNVIRDKVMLDLCQTASKTVAKMCKEMKMSPKLLFRPENAEQLIKEAK